MGADQHGDTMEEETGGEQQVIAIGELCALLGISTRTLRYWEEVGIIESVERTDRANRGYTDYMVRRIKFILKLKELGLTIREMQQLYELYGDAKKTDKMLPELLSIFDRHVAMIDEKMVKLGTLRNEIVEYRLKIVSKPF